MARTVIVGDVHGCATELGALLDKLALTSSDQVYFVGDLVARGPQSRRVLQMVSAVRGRSVRGNHEVRLIEAHHARLGGQPLPRLEASHQALFDTLTDEEWATLEAMPLTLEVPEGRLLIVHGGVVPGVPLEAQSPRLLTRLRTVRRDGSPSERLDGRLWGELYAGPQHVVFGHNAITGLQFHDHATGLDSGCVYGNALTALVLPTGSSVPARKERRDVLVHVQARDAYHALAR